MAGKYKMASKEVVEVEDGAAASEISTASPSFIKSIKQSMKKTKVNNDEEAIKHWEQDEEISPPRELRLQYRNQCVVISNKFLNQVGPNKQAPLPGYKFDEENIQHTFGVLNFEVIIKRDQKVGQMKEIVKSVSRPDGRERDCLVLFILSHGTEDGKIIGANNGQVSIQKEILHRLESLKLPKLVFIQACRGERFAPLIDETQPDSYKASGPTTVQRKVINADTFVFYSTMPGDVSFVDNGWRGSFFVDRLCAVLRCYNKPQMEGKYHLTDVVTKVNDLLSTYIKQYKDENNKNKLQEVGQVSQVSSSLTKRIYFQPVGDYSSVSDEE
jgi:hypothetical protein